MIHTAAKPGVWGKFDDYYRSNVLGTKNVVAACKKLQAKELATAHWFDIRTAQKDLGDRPEITFEKG